MILFHKILASILECLFPKACIVIYWFSLEFSMLVYINPFLAYFYALESKLNICYLTEKE